MSETAKIREKVLPFLKDEKSGLDIGYGGDPIVPSAITIDLPFSGRYCFDGGGVQHLFGYASRLHWFENHVLDYVYSSHLLEDFPNPLPILDEWLRVLKGNGILILYLPNEKRFKAHCDKTGQMYNNNHSNKDMSLELILDLLNKTTYRNKVIYSHDEVDEGYSFLVITEKII